MTEKSQLSKKAVVLYGVAFLVVAFVGVIAGNWFVSWRQSQALEDSKDEWLTRNDSLLRKGDAFPPADMLDLEATPVNFGTVLGQGKKIVAMFLSPGCEPCAMAVEQWKEEVNNIPEDLLVVGICTGEFDRAKDYQAETGFPYPMYSDTGYVFQVQYSLSSYPSFAGITADGKIAYVLHGLRPGFTLQDAYELIP